MNKPLAHDELDDKPLDPAVERLQQRLKRLLAVSSLIMVLGLGAVLSVIVYRVFLKDATPRVPAAFERPLTEALPMPEGGRVVSTAIDGTRALVTIEATAGTSVLLVDLETLKVLRRLEMPRAR